MLSFFRGVDRSLFKWCGVVQRRVIKPLFSTGCFKGSDLKSLIQFCYPTKDNLAGPQTFAFRYKPSDGEFYNVFVLIDQTSFQLTDLDINQQSCICIITSFSHFAIFEEILKVTRSLLLSSVKSTEKFLETLFKSPYNVQGLTNLNKYLSVPPLKDKMLTEIIKDSSILLTNDELARIIIGIMTDTSIIVVSSDLSKLSRFSYSLLAIISPLQWNLMFAPILPLALIESVQSPAPFIIGLHKSLIPNVQSFDIEGHLLIDIDDQKLMARGLNKIPNWLNKISVSLQNGTLKEFRKFIITVITKSLKVHPANTVTTTIKRINEAYKTTRFNPQSFAHSLIMSRTLQSFFEAIGESRVSPEFIQLVQLGCQSKVTSLAIQHVDEFPIKNKRMARSKSMKMEKNGEKFVPSTSMPMIKGKYSDDSSSPLDTASAYV